MQEPETLTVLTMARTRAFETEFRIDLHSPATGDSRRFLVYGSRQHAANLKALAYAQEDTGDPSWRTLSILSEPSPGDLMTMSDEDFWSDDF